VRDWADVIIVGGGPFGLMLANELGRVGIATELFDQKDSAAFNPQANATHLRARKSGSDATQLARIMLTTSMPQHPTIEPARHRRPPACT
jgi:2-polyprenyl-6-methoxyphenol hydroxylase-like FAD-dependent oxidoreductase